MECTSYFKDLHFETIIVWAPMVQVRRVKRKSFYIMIVMFLISILSLWSNNREHNIHDTKRLLPSPSLAHVISIVYILPNVVGKSCLQRPIQVGLPCIWKNNICGIFACHVMFSQIPCLDLFMWSRSFIFLYYPLVQDMAFSNTWLFITKNFMWKPMLFWTALGDILSFGPPLIFNY